MVNIMPVSYEAFIISEHYDELRFDKINQIIGICREYKIGIDEIKLAMERSSTRKLVGHNAFDAWFD